MAIIVSLLLANPLTAQDVDVKKVKSIVVIDSDNDESHSALKEKIFDIWKSEMTKEDKGLAIRELMVGFTPHFSKENCDKTKKAYMGVQISNTENGVLVDEVKKETGAHKGGMLIGDVILSVDKADTKTMDELLEKLREHKVGDIVSVKLLRNNKKKTVQVQLGEKPFSKMRGFQHHSFNKDFKMPKEKVAFLGVYSSTNSDKLTIDKVVPNSAAEKAQLLKNDVIISVNGVKTGNISDLAKVLRNLEPNSNTTILYTRNGQEFSKDVTLGEKEVFAYQSYKGCNSKKGFDKTKMEEKLKKLEDKDFFQDKDVDIQIFELPNNDVPSTPKKANEASTSLLNVTDFKVYPNPNKGIFDIQFTLSERADTEIRINDLAGKEVYFQSIPALKGMYASKIELNDVDAGAYIIQVSRNGKIFTEKLIIN